MKLKIITYISACIGLAFPLAVNAQEPANQEHYYKVSLEEFNKFIKGVPDDLDNMPGFYFLIVAAEDGKIMTHNGYSQSMYDDDTDFLKCYPLTQSGIELNYANDGDDLYLDADNPDQTGLKFLFHKYTNTYELVKYCVNIKHPDGRFFSIKNTKSIWDADYDRDCIFTNSTDLDKCKFELSSNDSGLLAIGLYEDINSYNMSYFLTYELIRETSKDKSFMIEETDKEIYLFNLYMLDHFGLKYADASEDAVKLSANICLPDNTKRYDLALKYIINDGTEVSEEELLASDNIITVNPEDTEISIPHTTADTSLWVLPVMANTIASRAAETTHAPLGRVSNFVVPDNETGIIAISATEADIPVVYYNLQGHAVSSPTYPGIYIKAQGDHVEKVIIR